MTSDAPSTPPADIEITIDLAKRLLRDQCPELSGLPVKIMEAGWDNVMVRVGSEMALRLPRRAIAADLILKEQKWLPWLAPRLPLSIPVPHYAGVPTSYYPYPWSLQFWLQGQPADVAPPEAGEAPVLAEFLKALHSLRVPYGAPTNPVRDCGLVGKKLDTEKRIQILIRETDVITDNILNIWQTGLEADVDRLRVFIAGDVHARNVLTKKGRLSAIIDWGDMCVGDPATDLASIWGLFADAKARRIAIEAYGMNQALQARTKGWAVFYGVILLQTGRKDTPRHAKMGMDILRRLNKDEAHLLSPAHL